MITRRDVTHPPRIPRRGRGQASAHAAELREVLDDGDRPKNSLIMLYHASVAETDPDGAETDPYVAETDP